MIKHFSHTQTILLVTILPIAFLFTILLVRDSLLTRHAKTSDTEWVTHIEDVSLPSDSLGLLTEHLYDEVRGKRRSGVLETIMNRISIELDNADSPASPLLTDLLRNLALEHPENRIRLKAYTTMVASLESEEEAFHDKVIDMAAY
ncbi:MAG: hypothetical protein WD097_06090 [Balneolales bacterium]